MTLTSAHVRSACRALDQGLLDGTDALELNGRHVETIDHRRSRTGFCWDVRRKVTQPGFPNFKVPSTIGMG